MANPPVLTFNISPAVEFVNNVIAPFNPHTRVWFFSSTNKREFVATLLHAMFEGTDMTAAMLPCISILTGMGAELQQATDLCHEFAAQVYKCLSTSMPEVTLDPSLYRIQSFQFDMLTISYRAVACPEIYRPLPNPLI